MSLSDWFLLSLRVGHALAATVWLGGGVYFLLAVRPVMRESDEAVRGVLGSMQRQFGEWAEVATIVMVATGIVLGFDRLSDGDGGFAYATLLAVKVVAAALAFWLAGVRPVRRALRRGSSRRAAPELILALGLLAFVLGVVLSAVWGRGLA